MATEIYIISGFLGAGKTTLIQKLLKEAFAKDKVVLIENDFGEISVDAALLKAGGVEVKEMNSGCICCSLSGDFVKALKEILDRFHPDKIIIEPSGVGKLSDILKACADPALQTLVEVRSRITVVDVKRCGMYLDNFGEFFADQIQNADLILLSRVEKFPALVDEAHRLIKGLNVRSAVLAKPWSELTAAEILPGERERTRPEGHRGHPHGCGCKHDHGDHVDCHHEQGDYADGQHERGNRADCHHDHGDHAGCQHDHSAEDVFDNITIRTERVFSMEELNTRIAKMEHSAQGTILRMKGIVRGKRGYLHLQYLPGDLRIEKSATPGDMLCIIGRNLNQPELVELFLGE